MSKYPLWVVMEYQEVGKRIGYTGCVNSRAALVDAMIRLTVHLSDIHSFKINSQLQPLSVLEHLFEEVEKERRVRLETREKANK